MKRSACLAMLAVAPTVLPAQVPPSAANIDSTALERTTERTVTDALRGRAAGVRVITTSGQPGSVPSAVIRSAGINGGTDPLFIIDGVPARLGLAELNVRDIERIEILKGAATASDNGIGASNGVIVVTTRRRGTNGRDGMAVKLRSEFGRNAAPAMPATGAFHPFQLTADGRGFVRDGFGQRVRELDGIADNPYPAYLEPTARIVADRPTLANFLSVSDRFAGVGAHASLGHDRDAGIIRQLDAYRRRHARVALDGAWLSDRLRVSGGAYVARSADDAPPSVATLFSDLHRIEPWVRLDSLVQPCPAGVNACYASRVYAGSIGTFPNPLLQLEATPTESERLRHQGQLSASYAVNSWLGADAMIATDRGAGTMRSIREPVVGDPVGGLDSAGDTARVSYTALALTARRDFRSGVIRTRTRLQYSDEQLRRDSHRRSETGAASSETSMFERHATKTFSLATTATVGEPLALSAAISRPQLRSFLGREDAIYHRVDASYQVNAPLRLHLAYGTSSPPLPRLDAVDVFAQGPLQLPFATEWEAGVDYRLPRDLRARYTWSRQRTNGFIGVALVPLNLGSGTTWANIGDALGYTHELSVRGPVLRRRAVSWDAALNLHRVSAHIADMTRPEFVTPDGAYVRAGEPIGRIYGRRWIHTAEQLSETINGGWLPGAPSDYVMNDDGFYVRASEIGTPAEVPLPYLGCPDLAACSGAPALLSIGDVTPDLELGFVNDVRVGPVTLSATLTGAFGGDVLNQQRMLTFRTGRAPDVDQATRTSGTPKPESYYTAMALGLRPNELFVESATHIALRELVLEWDLPARWVSGLATSGVQLGVAGRNLWTSGSYHGYHPDVVSSSARVTASGIDRGLHPGYRTLVATLRVGI